MSGYLTTLAGKHVPVRNGFVIGRVAGCDLVIDDSKASRRHARIVVEAGVAEVEDLDSSNGTRLNDKPVTRRVLRDGDRIQIGATVLVYREGQAAAAAAPAAAAKPAPAAADADDLLANAPTLPRPLPTPAPAPPPAPAKPASPFADDDDLLGDGPTLPLPPAPPAARVGPPAAAPPPASKPPAAPPPPAAVEFADEVVEVRKPAAAPAAKPAAPAQPGAAPSTSGRILQFHKQAGGGGGLLSDDLGQVGGGMRALFVLGALALGAGIVWLTIRLVG